MHLIPTKNIFIMPVIWCHSEKILGLVKKREVVPVPAVVVVRIEDMMGPLSITSYPVYWWNHLTVLMNVTPTCNDCKT
jgi:hypothetical protein